MDAAVEPFEQALLSMDREGAGEIMAEGLKRMEPVSFVEAVMVRALEHIGESWETGTVSLSQVYMSGRMCEEFMNQILPPGGSIDQGHPRIAIAVLEDYHMLGKRLVNSVLTAHRLDPVDYGRMETDELVRQVEEDRIEVLLISTLMLPSALQTKALIGLLADRGLNVPVIVGGAPFRLDKALYREVGADATADRASDVVRVIRQVVRERP